MFETSEGSAHDVIHAYCDGGCNNITKEKAYGSFAVFIDEENEVIQRYRFDHIRTSNEAEYEILIKLLEYLVENNITDVIINSDSKLTVMQVNGTYGVYAPNLIPKCIVAKELLSKLSNSKLEWTPRKNIVSILGH